MRAEWAPGVIAASARSQRPRSSLSSLASAARSHNRTQASPSSGSSSGRRLEVLARARAVAGGEHVLGGAQGGPGAQLRITGGPRPRLRARPAPRSAGRRALRRARGFRGLDRSADRGPALDVDGRPRAPARPRLRVRSRASRAGARARRRRRRERGGARGRASPRADRRRRNAPRRVRRGPRGARGRADSRSRRAAGWRSSARGCARPGRRAGRARDGLRGCSSRPVASSRASSAWRIVSSGRASWLATRVSAWCAANELASERTARSSRAWARSASSGRSDRGRLDAVARGLDREGHGRPRVRARRARFRSAARLREPAEQGPGRGVLGGDGDGALGPREGRGQLAGVGESRREQQVVGDVGGRVLAVAPAPEGLVEQARAHPSGRRAARGRVRPGRTAVRAARRRGRRRSRGPSRPGPAPCKRREPELDRAAPSALRSHRLPAGRARGGRARWRRRVPRVLPSRRSGTRGLRGPGDRARGPSDRRGSRPRPTTAGATPGRPGAVRGPSARGAGRACRARARRAGPRPAPHRRRSRSAQRLRPRIASSRKLGVAFGLAIGGAARRSNRTARLREASRARASRGAVPAPSARKLGEPARELRLATGAPEQVVEAFVDPQRDAALRRAAGRRTARGPARARPPDRRARGRGCGRSPRAGSVDSRGACGRAARGGSRSARARVLPTAAHSSSRPQARRAAARTPRWWSSSWGVSAVAVDVRAQVGERLLGLRERDAVELGERPAQLDAGAPVEGRHALLEQDRALERAVQGLEQRVEPRQDRGAVGGELEGGLIGEHGAARCGELLLEESARARAGRAGARPGRRGASSSSSRARSAASNRPASRWRVASRAQISGSSGRSARRRRSQGSAASGASFEPARASAFLEQGLARGAARRDRPRPTNSPAPRASARGRASRSRRARRALVRPGSSASASRRSSIARSTWSAPSPASRPRRSRQSARTSKSAAEARRRGRAGRARGSGSSIRADSERARSRASRWWGTHSRIRSRWVECEGGLVGIGARRAGPRAGAGASSVSAETKVIRRSSSSISGSRSPWRS